MARRPDFPAIAERIQRDYPASSPAELPPERDLAKRYATSRPTIRKALALLTTEGVLRRRARGAPATTSGQPTKRAATIVTYVGPVEGAFHGQLVIALLTQASARGYHFRAIPVSDGTPLPDDLAPRLAAMALS